MALPHTGSWGLPDFGLTERVGQLFGQQPNQQGGSNLVPNQVQNVAASFLPAPFQAAKAATTVYNQATRPGQGPAGVLGSVAPSQSLPQPAPLPTTGGGGGGNNFNDVYNRNYQGWDRTNALADYNANPNKFANAAQSGYDAQLAGLNTQYDRSRDQIQGQLGLLSDSLNQNRSTLDQELESVKNQVGTARTNAQTNTEKQIAEAGNTARSTQFQNRNVLRALGILNSSAAGDLLSKPVNEFDKQRASLNETLGQRFNELDNFIGERTKEHQTAVQGLVGNYQNLVGQIQGDLRFNERSRGDAIQAANSALQQRVADIQNSMMNYQNQVAMMKQQYGQQVQGLSSYQDPTYNQQGFQQQLLTTPQAQQQQIGVNPNIIDPQKKKQAGLLSAYG